MKASTISGAMNSAEPTGVRSNGVVSLPPPLNNLKDLTFDKIKKNAESSFFSNKKITKNLFKIIIFAEAAFICLLIYAFQRTL